MSIQLRDGLIDQSLDRVLEDLLVRFVVNVPEEDLSSIERIFFQVEEAHWFYLDYVRQLDPSLPSMKMKTFASKLLEKCPLIWKWGDPSDALARFGKYKSTIPVRGVALFNKDLTKVLLVKGTESNAWSFPRGKISKDESDVDCAVREAEEEIGFNCAELIDKNDYVERTIRGKNYKIFLVKNVSEDIQFEPVSKYEISQIKWFDIKAVQKKVKNNPNHFFIVATIIKPVMRWISKNKGVLSEEELMQQAEIKLKKLMGLNKQKENVDAGRELLNILQGAKPTSQSTEISGESINKQDTAPGITPMVNVQLPPHLQNQFPFLAGGAHPNMPFFMQPPMGNGPGQAPPFPHPGFFPHPSHHQQLPPNPESLMKPRGHSKELLSILTTKNENKKDNVSESKTRNEDSGNLRSRAQQLMSVFPKRKEPVENKNEKPVSKGVSRSESPISNKSASSQEKVKTKSDKSGLSKSSEKDKPSRQQPSNEIEESIRSSYQRQPAVGKKIKLLKRSDNKDSRDLLNLLGPKRESARGEEDGAHDQSPQKDTSAVKEDVNGPVQAQKQPETDRVASQQLLGFLHKEKPSKGHEGELENKKPTGIADVLNKETRDNDITPRVVSPTSDFLSLLKRPNNADSTSIVEPSLLANKPKPQQHKPQPSTSANKLLSLLGRKQSDSIKSGINQDIWSSQEKRPSITSPNALASIHKFDREVGSNQATLSNTIASPVSENWGFSQPEPYPQQMQQTDLSATNTLRDILRKNSAQPSPSLSGLYDPVSDEAPHAQTNLDQKQEKFDNFEDFEDFEDLDNFNAFNDKYIFDDESPPKTFNNFDVDSDDENVAAGYAGPQQHWHPAKQQSQQQQQSQQPYYQGGVFTQTQREETNPDNQATSNLVEPKFNLSTSSRTTIGQFDQSNNPGKGLLALLNRGKSP
ncbi:DCP2 [Candida metapsilosis]|uniref:DCP2 n=1 Tax=Candida metapsilosis TaxID=273372 RepID=A0A8H7ZIQ4_9ASCO|nr:DCP2 [Candida metapsilosis]